MDFKHFPLDKYLRLREKSERFVKEFYGEGTRRIAISQRPGYAFTGPICRYKEDQLANELEYIANSMRYSSDIMISALEPWYGVGIYAAGFGAKYIWMPGAAPQTRSFISGAEEIASLKLKPLSDWEEMREVIERIRYFKTETRGQVGITLCDTQSPNDTASLIMDTAEFFADCIDEPEAIEPLLTKVTDAIIEYSRIQIEEAGDAYSAPGHIAFSARNDSGIMLSCDNMAVISPQAFKNAEAYHLERLAKEFGSVSTHSCGKIHHNLNSIANVKGIRMFDCCIDMGDPNPNDPQKLADFLINQPELTAQVRINIHRAHLLKPLIDSGARLHIVFGTDPDPLVSNRLLESFREKYLS